MLFLAESLLKAAGFQYDEINDTWVDPVRLPPVVTVECDEDGLAVTEAMLQVHAVLQAADCTYNNFALRGRYVSIVGLTRGEVRRRGVGDTNQTFKEITMPKYEIEQYEILVLTYRVEASSEAEAIAKLFQGKAEPLDGSLELVEVSEDFGMPADENRELVDELRGLGVRVGEVIPSIRSVVEVE